MFPRPHRTRPFRDASSNATRSLCVIHCILLVSAVIFCVENDSSYRPSASRSCLTLGVLTFYLPVCITFLFIFKHFARCLPVQPRSQIMTSNQSGEGGRQLDGWNWKRRLLVCRLRALSVV
ncbi:hypothetical protein DFH11DRAFT_1608562 [Phellopilus nigrolimitatus]|nr:hypothetical protein DFH11DRAFT_1608562 [Phellopilus nigrolimitatus]